MPVFQPPDRVGMDCLVACHSALSEPRGIIMTMSEQEPEFNKLREDGFEHSDLSESKSITGSAQTVGFDPSDSFIAPTMALDAFEPESES